MQEGIFRKRSLSFPSARISAAVGESKPGLSCSRCYRVSNWEEDVFTKNAVSVDRKKRLFGKVRDARDSP